MPKTFKFVKDHFIYIGSWTFTTLTIFAEINHLLPIITAVLSALLSVSGIVLNIKKIIQKNKNHEKTN